MTTLLPGERRTGSEVASQAFVDGLRAEGHRVTVLGYRRTGSDPPRTADDVVVADRHIETSGAGARPLAWMTRALLTGEPYSAAKYVTRAYRRAVARRLQRSETDLVVIDHAQMGWLLRLGPWALPHVYLVHNVEHRLYADLAANGGIRRGIEARESRRIRRHEETLCRTAAAVWALTAEDASALSALGAEDRVSAFDLPPAASAGPPTVATCDVALLGSWTWRANAAGLEWFVDAVRPLLPDHLRVEVGGAGGHAITTGSAGMTIRGRVPDAAEFLRSARVIAVPAISGAGVQIKTLDAIASGRRVVATDKAMRGIADPPPTVRLADEPAEFAAAIMDALAAGGDGDAARVADEWTQLRRRAFRSQLGRATAALERTGP